MPHRASPGAARRRADALRGDPVSREEPRQRVVERALAGRSAPAPPPAPARAAARSARSCVKRRSESPDWRVPSSWPSPRSSRSTSASSKPSVVSTSASSRRDRRFGQLLLRPRDEQAVRLLRPAPDAAAQLVELREPEAVGLLDDHHRRVRDVDADLDHRRRDEDVQLARLEPRHQLAPVGRLQLPVQAADPEALQLGAPQPLGLLLGRPRARGLRLLDQRADDVRLPALREEPRQPPVRLRRALLLDPARHDRLPRRRRLRDLADRRGRRRRSARACAGSASPSCAGRAASGPPRAPRAARHRTGAARRRPRPPTPARSTPSWISACVPTRIDAPAAASARPLADRARQQAAP